MRINRDIINGTSRIKLAESMKQIWSTSAASVDQTTACSAAPHGAAIHPST
jgi:hypothetical protein